MKNNEMTYFRIGKVYIAKLENSYVIANLNNNEYYYFDGAKALFFDQLCLNHFNPGSNRATVKWSTIKPNDEIFSKEILDNSLILIKNSYIEIEKFTIKHPHEGTTYPWPTEEININLLYVASFMFSYILGSILFMIQKPMLSAKFVKLIKFRRQYNKYNIQQINKTFSIFSRIRKYFYTATEKCYYDSLILSIYLGLLGYNPKWIFAVQLHPFKAHCWVEVDSVIVNDDIAHVTPYNPVFAI
ncbi:lasso peptide biosynthesis B2 protein [Pedomonas mirosovicensis]|uniref:lasso peptide biosynthesis B2 protein n=1 Tax=Pedomonas mirosovicensis TaxID=2908641 RepID=UPI00216A9464|nr:lasso peptide biosynthesis B2 protein [Pedomonas mirosovicensis]MCH8686699.1 lasso peptide biosynthesis B2 protein [Pedomonas mirosovicensis]